MHRVGGLTRRNGALWRTPSPKTHACRAGSHSTWSRGRALLLVLAVCLAALPPALGETWYVSPSGSASEPCGTEGSPCQGFAQTFSLAASGDTIVLATGVYPVSSTLNWDKTMTVQGPGSDLATLTCGSPGATDSVMLEMITENVDAFITGVALRNCSRAMLVAASAPPPSVTFDKCSFGSALQQVLAIGGSAVATFTNCSFASMTASVPVIRAADASSITITDSYVNRLRLSSVGFVHMLSFTTLNVERCTVIGNSWSSFARVMGSSRASVNDTTFLRNHGALAAVLTIRNQAKVVTRNITVRDSTGSAINANVQFVPGGAGAGFLVIEKSRFLNNNKVSLVAKEGGAIWAAATVSSLYNKDPDASILISDTTFADNEALADGGALYLSRVHTTFERTNLLRNEAAKGGAVAFVNGGSLTLRECEVLHNRAEAGGAFNLDDPADSLKGVFSLTGGHVANNTAQYGGVMAITAVVNGLTLTVSDVEMSDNRAGQEGGVFWYQDQVSGSTQFTRCQFNRNIATVGGVVMQGGAFVASYSHCTFTGNRAKFGAVVATDQQAKGSFTECGFFNNTAANEGGVSYAKLKSVIAMYHSNVTHNQATRGGAFFGQDDTNTTLDFCNVRYNTADNGAVTYLLGDITANGRPFFLVADSEFSHNTADFGAVTYAAVATFSTTDRCKLFDNVASASGGVLYLSGNSVATFAESQAWANTAGFDGGIMYISDATKISVWRSSFLTSTALRGGAFFGTDTSQYFITQSVIRFNNGTMGGAIHLDGVPYNDVNARMNITLSTLSDNTGVLNGVGGAAFLSGDTVLSVSASNITHNIAKFGGAYYSRDDGIGGFDHCDIYENHADQGGFMYGDTRSNTLISNCLIHNNTAVARGGVAYTADEASVTFTLSRASENSAVYGGFIAAMVNSTARIDQVTVINNVAKLDGGVFYMDSNPGAPSESKGFCTDSHLTHNLATRDGGAMFISEAAQANVQRCTFTENAADEGGAVFAQQRQVHGDVDNCKTFVFLNNTFLRNHARTAGGVLAWNFNDDQTYSPCTYCGDKSEDACTFDGNTAGKYRPITSTPLVATIFVSSGHWIETKTSRPVEDVTVTTLYSNATFTSTIHTYMDCEQKNVTAVFPTITSGEIITPPLVISGKDFYGQPFDNELLRASLVVSAAPNDATAASAGGSTVADSDQGKAKFNNLFFIAKPGSTQQVTFNVLEPTQIASLVMWIKLRECEQGEVEPENSNVCQVCPPGKFSWDPTASLCEDCPLNALCQGGKRMKPFAGYWRSSNESTQFHECPLESACLGAPRTGAALFDENDQPIDHTERCAEGYSGRLCHRCVPGYGRSGQNGCAKCPDRGINLLLISAGVVAAFFVMGFLIYTTRKSAKDDKDLMMMMIKIFMSYIQFVSLAVGLEIDWPAPLMSLFRAQQGASSVTELFISFDCALGSPGDGQSGQEGTELFYKTQILYFFIPFIGVGFICLFWTGMFVFRAYLRKAETRRATDLKKIMTENAIVSTLVLLFFMHPTLTTRTFMMFACREIDEGEFFLVQDLDIRCYDVAHTLWIVVLGLPAVVLFVVGIPLGAFIVLYRRRHLLTSKDPVARYDVKIRFGFLYAGFEIQYYYWECVIMIRKVLVISIVVFFSQFGSLVQTGAALGLVYLAYNAHLWAMPYEEDVLDDLEKYSLLTSLFTFYAGIFLNAPTIDEGWSIVVVVLIFLVQISYILLFIKTIRGEVGKKVKEIKDKVKEKAKLQLKAGKGKRRGASRLATDAERQAEVEYLAKMRAKEAEGDSARKRRRRAQIKAQKKGIAGSIFSMFTGGNKRQPPRRRRLQTASAPAPADRRGSSSAGEDESKSTVDVGNPLNQLDDPASPVAAAVASRTGTGSTLQTRVHL